MRGKGIGLATAAAAGLAISATAQAQFCGNTTTGPDVIVGDINGVTVWGNVTQTQTSPPVSVVVRAFSFGTDSCNIGSQPVNWIQNTNQHPVIGQNVYRLKTVNGSTRFEQIGQSWLKNGFFAESNFLCCSVCHGFPDGSHLGVGCSDPYTSSRNGSQSLCSPKSQVNASTGVFTYPFSAPTAPATIGRRCQIMLPDLDPAVNTGATYFVEAQYTASDDAGAHNNNNNASYRRLTLSGTSPNFNLALTASTVRLSPAIQAWQDNGLGIGVSDPNITVAHLDVTGDGRFLVGFKVTPLGGGIYHYEYAIENLTSDRCGGSFSIPVPAGVAVTNIDFHDVFNHSGEPFPNTVFNPDNWNAAVAGGALTWTCPEPYIAPGNNANALRWGTLYNFRFDANTAPVTATATLGLFKPGAAPNPTLPVLGPGAAVCAVDINGDGSVNVADFLAYLALYSAGDPRADFNADGSVNVADFLAYLAAYALGC
jgi:hypothetical protein